MAVNFQSKIALSFITLLAVLCLVLGVYLVHSLWTGAMAGIRSSLDRTAAFIVHDARSHYQAEGFGGVEDLVSRLNRGSADPAITWISPNGEVLVGPAAGAAVDRDVSATPEFRQAQAEGAASLHRYSVADGQEMYFAMYPVEAGGETIGFLRLGYPLAPVYETLQRAILGVLAALTLAVLVATILSALIARALSNRLHELSLAARRLAGGNWNDPVRTSGRDEVADLARTIDDLRQDLRSLFMSERSRSRLEGVNLTARELAHRLNNDLTITVGHLDLVADSPETPVDVRVRIQQALDGLERSLDDIRKFQQVVRVETKSTPSGLTLDLDRSVSLPRQVPTGATDRAPDVDPAETGPVLK